MKKILLLLAVLYCNYVNAQNITINVVGGDDPVVKINYPVNGINYIYWENQKTYKLDANNSTRFSNTMKTPGFIYVINNGKHKRVFIEPRKSLNIEIINTDKDQSLKITGANAEGIMRYTSLNHPFYQSASWLYFKKDSTMAGIKQAISLDMAKELRPFDSLLKAKKISAAFYGAARRDIRFYYMGVSASVIFNQYYRTGMNPKHPLYKTTFDKDFEDEWPRLYKANAPGDQLSMDAPEYFYYAKDYVTWYKLYYQARKSGKFEPYKADEQLDKFYDGFTLSFKGRALEYILARYIFDEAMEKQYQQKLVDLYNMFISYYPTSNYIPFIKPAVDEIIAYHKRAAAALSAEQTVLPNKNIGSFDQLMAASFKGKTVYVDMWATWCGPCKDEFQYSADLHKYLKQNNVEMLYISMDNNAADKQWQDMIKFYGLSGNHIRVNDSLLKDLINRFWDGKGYAIPRYVLVKDGAVVEQEALHPSDKEKLYEQISKHL